MVTTATDAVKVTIEITVDNSSEWTSEVRRHLSYLEAELFYGEAEKPLTSAAGAPILEWEGDEDSKIGQWSAQVVERS